MWVFDDDLRWSDVENQTFPQFGSHIRKSSISSAFWVGGRNCREAGWLVGPVRGHLHRWRGSRGRSQTLLLAGGFPPSRGRHHVHLKLHKVLSKILHWCWETVKSLLNPLAQRKSQQGCGLESVVVWSLRWSGVCEPNESWHCHLGLCPCHPVVRWPQSRVQKLVPPLSVLRFYPAGQ